MKNVLNFVAEDGFPMFERPIEIDVREKYTASRDRLIELAKMQGVRLLERSAFGNRSESTASNFQPPNSAQHLPALAREADPVSWLTKARNFATATAKHIAAGMPTASDEVILERWSICQGCEFLKNDACSKCGCPVARDRKFVSKLAWADQSCPVGKWGPASA